MEKLWQNAYPSAGRYPMPSIAGHFTFKGVDMYAVYRYSEENGWEFCSLHKSKNQAQHFIDLVEYETAGPFKVVKL